MKTLYLLFGFCLITLAALPATAQDVWRDPARACALLDPVGIETRGYKDQGDKSYGCSSPYQEIPGGQSVPNNIAYYVTGTKDAVKELKLTLNVNDRSQAERAHLALATTSKVLLGRALAFTLTDEMIEAFGDGKGGSWSVNGRKVEITYELWPTNLGYSVRFLIKR